MGFKPVLDKTKTKHKKGLWSPDEDMKLKNYIMKHGHGCWSSIPINAGLQRNGKSCRLRWINYLRPGLKRGAFTLQEEEAILTLHRLLGNKWSQISQHLPGRTDNEIKNYWHSYLKKRVSGMVEIEPEGTKNMTYINEQKIEISEFSPKSTKRKSSFENTETSTIGTDQSMQHRDNSGVTQNSNLPKILFAEWLSLDQFHDQKSLTEETDPLFHGLMPNDGAFMGAKSNSISVDDMLQSQFKFEDELSVSGCHVADYFPGDITGHIDDMYIF